MPAVSRHLMSLLHAVGLVLAAYAVVLVGLWWLQPRLLYHPDVPSRSVEQTPADAGLDYESVRLHTADGLELDAWFVPGPGRDSPVVLFLHGNAGNIGHRIETLAMLHEAGAATLILDYRGFGRSEGHPSERGTYRDALAAWRWLTGHRGQPPQRIVLIGRSLGGAIAAWLAARVQPAALVLEASFTSITDLGQYHYPWAPIRWISRFRYNTAAQLARVRSPVLIAHGDRDDVVPYRHAHALVEAVPNGAELVMLEGGHNDAMMISRPRYTEILRRFIHAHAGKRVETAETDRGDAQ